MFSEIIFFVIISSESLYSIPAGEERDEISFCSNRLLKEPDNNPTFLLKSYILKRIQVSFLAGFPRIMFSQVGTFIP